MHKLNKPFLEKQELPEHLVVPLMGWDTLPERVLQFGTGVLLRGLPGYFIDKANRNGIFNGRIVVVKSTEGGGAGAFAAQDGLYTLHIKGIQDGEKVQSSVLVSAISRVLSASSDWQDILDTARDPAIEVVISNTTEVGIAYDENDSLEASPPTSFPGKLTALLYRRFQHFKGDETKGWVILPTELISDNGTNLKTIVRQLAHLHKLGEDFIAWLDQANDFCNTLVDRIVPGRLTRDQYNEATEQLGYIDDLAIMAEPFCLWAIESANPRVSQRLSFTQADEGIVVAPCISKFKQLKLRLLNGTHTFSCGLAALCGFDTVKEAMRHEGFAWYVSLLMKQEIVPAIVGERITTAEALDFADKVIDRFSNPFLHHPWLNISLNYTSKMQMRNLEPLQHYMQYFSMPPMYMALGFAAYLRFMKSKRQEDGTYQGNIKETFYTINDEHAPYFASLWSQYDLSDLVHAVLKNQSLWKTDLSKLSGFAQMVTDYLQQLLDNDAGKVMTQLENN